MWPHRLSIYYRLKSIDKFSSQLLVKLKFGVIFKNIEINKSEKSDLKIVLFSVKVWRPFREDFKHDVDYWTPNCNCRWIGCFNNPYCLIYKKFVLPSSPTCGLYTIFRGNEKKIKHNYVKSIFHIFKNIFAPCWLLSLRH